MKHYGSDKKVSMADVEDNASVEMTLLNGKFNSSSNTLHSESRDRLRIPVWLPFVGMVAIGSLVLLSMVASNTWSTVFSKTTITTGNQALINTEIMDEIIDLDLDESALAGKPYLPENFAVLLTMLKPCSSTGGAYHCTFEPYGGAPDLEQFGVVQINGIDYVKIRREIYVTKDSKTVIIDSPPYHPGVRVVKRSLMGSNAIETFQVDGNQVLSHCETMPGIELDVGLPPNYNYTSLGTIEGSAMKPFEVSFFPNIPANSTGYARVVNTSEPISSYYFQSKRAIPEAIVTQDGSLLIVKQFKRGSNPFFFSNSALDVPEADFGKCAAVTAVWNAENIGSFTAAQQAYKDGTLDAELLSAWDWSLEYPPVVHGPSTMRWRDFQYYVKNAAKTDATNDWFAWAAQFENNIESFGLNPIVVLPNVSYQLSEATVEKVATITTFLNVTLNVTAASSAMLVRRYLSEYTIPEEASHAVQRQLVDAAKSLVPKEDEELHRRLGQFEFYCAVQTNGPNAPSLNIGIGASAIGFTGGFKLSLNMPETGVSVSVEASLCAFVIFCLVGSIDIKASKNPSKGGSVSLDIIFNNLLPSIIAEMLPELKATLAVLYYKYTPATIKYFKVDGEDRFQSSTGSLSTIGGTYHLFPLLGCPDLRGNVNGEVLFKSEEYLKCTASGWAKYGAPTCKAVTKFNVRWPGTYTVSLGMDYFCFWDWPWNWGWRNAGTWTLVSRNF